jgi:hypothetical protein
MSQLPEINVKLHKKQTVAYNSRATEILYGGAAGGGKSHLMRVAAIVWCSMVAGLQVYLFRKVTKDLVKNHIEGPKGFRSLLAPWVMFGFAQIVDKEIRFWNGSKIYLCHCEHEKNMYDFDGAEIHLLLIDELTHFTEKVYRFLRGRVRAVGLPPLPAHLKGLFPRIICGTNPGNVGHLWVKKTFIDNCKPLEIRQVDDDEGGMLRQFIPALLDDNPSMLEDDPTYRAKLKGLGSKALVRAKLEGDWNVVEGAYFDNWSDIHIIKPFRIPTGWTKFRSFDWGSAKPFSVGWYAISNGYQIHKGLYIPKGAMVKYREWYGCKKGKTDVGLKLTVEQVAKGINERSGEEKYAYSVADPAIFSEDGGPSMAKRFSDKEILFNRADNKRTPKIGAVGGWDQMRSRLEGMDGIPMLFFFAHCFDSIRTIPALQHDPNNPEDLDTKMEDHCLVGDTKIITDRGNIKIKHLVGKSGFVLTTKGLKKYYHCRKTRKNAGLVKVMFNNSSFIICTPDHRFLTVSGWQEAQNLKGELCESRKFQEQSKNSMAFHIINAGHISKEKVIGCIEKCIYITKGIYQKVIASIILTMTGRIMILETLNYEKTKSIAATTVNFHRSEKKQSRLHKRQPVNGMEVKRVWNGTQNIMRNISGLLCWIKLKKLVSYVAENTKSLKLFQKSANGVVIIARQRLCVGVEKLKERQDVYCMSVDDVHEFAIDNGVIVHNCADECRYACMSDPWAAPEPQEESDLPKDRYMIDEYEEEEQGAWRTV